MFGVGGGFLITPLLILIGIPPAVAVATGANQVAGTSLFQILFVTAATTLMHAITSHTVDAILAVMLLLGGVIGAQVGAHYAPRMKAEQMRVALALLVLVVCAEIGLELIRDPAEVFIVVSGHAP